MDMEEMKQTILDYLNNEWEDYNTIYTELCDIIDFIKEWTDFDYRKNDIIHNEIKNELNMDNIFDIIRYCEDKYVEFDEDEPFSVFCKSKLLDTFINYVGLEFQQEKINVLNSIRGSPS